MLLQYISDTSLMQYALRLSQYTAAITLLNNCILHTKVKESPYCKGTNRTGGIAPCILKLSTRVAGES